MPMPVTDYAGMADNMVELAGGLSGARKLIEKGIRAFHGSPHSFEKFDINKIGTGEGAQAFGHGLYFAENPAVAETYKNSPRVTDMDWRVLGGPEGWTVPAWVARGAQSSRGRAGEILADFENRVREHELNDPEFFNLGGLRNIRDAIKGHLSGEMQFQKPGHMYEVNINAAPSEFLDFDLPLQQQSAAHRQALTDAWLAHPSLNENLGQWQGTLKSFGEREAKQLREAGIPGIRYYDQGSRPLSGGTRNYTVFDDKLIDIVRKYGMAGLAGPALAAAGLNTEKQQ